MFVIIVSMADRLAAEPAAAHRVRPVNDLLRRIRAGELSCAETLEPYLERIAQHDSELHAWAGFDPALARAQASALDALPAADRLRLPLLGLPVAVKDVFDTTALPTEYGSEIYRGHRPDRDAATVAALRAAGAVIVGKTKTAELAWMHPTDTRNPLDPQRTPGGSSSGSAAAVAAAMVPLALGTQTGGSIIRPASFCGVVGYKPTFGLLSRDGVLPVSAALDTVGWLARHPEDARAATAALLALERLPTTRASLPVDLAAAPHDDSWRPRIGFVRGSWELIEPEGRDAFDAALAAAEAAGAELDELPLADELAEIAQAQATVQQFETARSLAREATRTSGSRISDMLADYIAGAASISADDYLTARRVADERRWVWQERIAEQDALLVPSTLGPPPLGLGSTGDSLPCRAWTLLGMPCVAIPIAWTPAGMPMGIQLVGPLHRDGAVIDVATWLTERIECPADARQA